MLLVEDGVAMQKVRGVGTAASRKGCQDKLTLSFILCSI